MLYLHQLHHLNAKSADLESVPIIRELKQQVRFPLTADHLRASFTEFFFTPTDKELMEHALLLVEPTAAQVLELLQEHSDLYESINLQRAIAILQELPPALHKNIAYLEQILPWQEEYCLNLVPVLNSIPRAKSVEERKAWAGYLDQFFRKILRNDQLAFNSGDIINEAHQAHVSGLSESMAKGFFFHVSLEEELKKISYEILKQRLPSDAVQKVEHIYGNVEVIKKGVERAYAGNMRMVNWVVVMFAYVKWLSSKWEKF